jgi:hypothetical protein
VVHVTLPSVPEQATSLKYVEGSDTGAPSPRRTPPSGQNRIEAVTRE